MTAVLRGLLLLALAWFGAAAAAEQVLPEGAILAAADLREGTTLDGTWTYSIDPYRDGVAGLWVVDASIIPTIPQGNTNATAIMIGERASDLVLDAVRQ